MAAVAKARVQAVRPSKSVAASAKQGPPGPDGWAEPIQVISHDVAGPLEIDYAEGKYVKLALNANVTQLTVVGFPVGYFARLQLSITQGGGFALTFPAGVRPAEQSTLPVVSIRPGAIDVFLLTSDDGGGNTLLYVAGQNH